MQKTHQKKQTNKKSFTGSGAKKTYAKPTGGKKPFGAKKNYGKKTEDGERKYTPSTGKKPSFGKKPFGAKKPFGKKSEDGERSYARSSDKKTSYGKKFGDKKKSFSEKPKRSYEKRPIEKEEKKIKPLDLSGERKVVLKNVDREGEGVRLDKYVQQLFPTLPFGRIQTLIRTKQIKVNRKRAEKDYRLALNDEVRIPPIEVREAAPHKEYDKKLDLKKYVIFKDENIIVLNKPSGLAAQGGPKLKNHVAGNLDDLMYNLKTPPMIAHRLDKETSGILILARTHRAARELGELFKTGKIEKTYIAEVDGHMEEKEGKIDAPLLKEFEKVIVSSKGQRAISFYKVLMNEENSTIVELSPKTGRTHQLRVHMAHIGHPILGDTKYNPKKRYEIKRLYLHAFKIRFKLDGKDYEIIAPLPPEMKGKHIE